MKLYVQVLFVVTMVAIQEQEATAAAAAAAATATVRLSPLTAPAAEPLSADEEAAMNARYFFSSDVDDQISDLKQHRDEQRDGLKVKGSYSYSDGFFSRKVVYEADENGYRVISDEMVPLDGPNGDPAGSASVHSQVDGTQTNYTLTTPQKKMIPTEVSRFDSREEDDDIVTSSPLALTPQYYP